MPPEHIQPMTMDMTFERLELDEDTLAKLRSVGDDLRGRSHARSPRLGERKAPGGIVVLFAGPSGTGKTMAAQALGNAIDVDVYRIDLSQIASKYIGETEKNLRRVFDRAENLDCIWFFDEADALFGRRTEVKDSHDRCANQDVGYLLERLESFDGIVILATNSKADLDERFLRRLRFVVHFPRPNPSERERIWEGSFDPPQARRTD